MLKFTEFCKFLSVFCRFFWRGGWWVVGGFVSDISVYIIQNNILQCKAL